MKSPIQIFEYKSMELNSLFKVLICNLNYSSDQQFINYEYVFSALWTVRNNLKINNNYLSSLIKRNYIETITLKLKFNFLCSFYINTLGINI